MKVCVLQYSLSITEQAMRGHEKYSKSIRNVPEGYRLTFFFQHQTPTQLIGFKISAKFQPNFAKFGNFGGDRKKTPKFYNTLIHVLYNSKLIFFYYLYCIFFYSIDV